MDNIKPDVVIIASFSNAQIFSQQIIFNEYQPKYIFMPDYNSILSINNSIIL